MVYNHTYMPHRLRARPASRSTGRSREGVTLWDVGAERQAQLRGPDALSFADYLSPRDLLDLAVGRCRFSPVCDPRGQVMADCIVLRPFEDTVWYSHSDCDISLWAYGLALARGARVEVEEADVAPLQLQGPLAAAVLEPLYGGDLGGAAALRLRAAWTSRACRASSPTPAGARRPGSRSTRSARERCLELWDAIVAAGEPHGLLVTGPNITRAVEQGITDTQYKMNSGMTALEAGLESMLQLDGDDFMGRDALRRRAGARLRAAARSASRSRASRSRSSRTSGRCSTPAATRSASPAGPCSPTRSSRTSPSRSSTAGVGDADELVVQGAGRRSRRARPPDPVRLTARSLD